MVGVERKRFTVAGYGALGLWGGPVTRYFLWSLPGVAVAILLGRAINLRLHGDGFLKFVYVGLTVVGVILVVQAIG